MYSQGSSYVLSAFLICACLCLAYGAENTKASKTLTCWACSSNTTDDPCVNGTKLNSSVNVETCSGPEAVCIKMYSHVYGIIAGDEDWSAYPPVVSRFCAKEHPLHDLGCETTDGIKGQQINCLCDDHDNCNTGSRAALNIAVVTITALLVSLL